MLGHSTRSAWIALLLGAVLAVVGYLPFAVLHYRSAGIDLGIEQPATPPSAER